ncbi:hypothetical protein D3C72_1252130 [compost metagenome]
MQRLGPRPVKGIFQHPGGQAIQADGKYPNLQEQPAPPQCQERRHQHRQRPQPQHIAHIRHMPQVGAHRHTDMLLRPPLRRFVPAHQERMQRVGRVGQRLPQQQYGRHAQRSTRQGPWRQRRRHGRIRPQLRAQSLLCTQRPCGPHPAIRTQQQPHRQQGRYPGVEACQPRCHLLRSLRRHHGLHRARMQQ